jgi:hypothetical protein
MEYLENVVPQSKNRGILDLAFFNMRKKPQ